MIQELEVSLRAWSRSSPDLEPRALQEALAAPAPPMGVSREGSARLILWAINVIEDLASYEDKAEAFAETAPDALGEVAAWLAKLSPGAVRAVAARGYTVDLAFDVATEQDQLDLTLPPALLGELGRLGLPIALTTRAWEA